MHFRDCHPAELRCAATLLSLGSNDPHAPDISDIVARSGRTQFLMVAEAIVGLQAVRGSCQSNSNLSPFATRSRIHARERGNCSRSSWRTRRQAVPLWLRPDPWTATGRQDIFLCGNLRAVPPMPVDCSLSTRRRKYRSSFRSSAPASNAASENDKVPLDLPCPYRSCIGPYISNNIHIFYTVMAIPTPVPVCSGDARNRPSPFAQQVSTDQVMSRTAGLLGRDVGQARQKPCRYPPRYCRNAATA